MGEADSPFASLTDNNTTVLVLDRRNDPISPLLMVWTYVATEMHFLWSRVAHHCDYSYQAMIHELLGIKKNRVNMKDVPSAPEDLKEVVLSADQDAFYAEHMYHDFGELGVAVQDLVRRYQANRNTHKNITTLGMLVCTCVAEWLELSNGAVRSGHEGIHQGVP
jgi:vacuolar protein sorting-associated protein 45